MAQIGKHTVISGSTLPSLTALNERDAEFQAVVKGGQVGPSLIHIHRSGNSFERLTIQSDSFTANSLTDRLGAGFRTKHIDTRFFGVEGRVQDGDLSMKKVPSAKICADIGTKPVSALSTTTRLQICNIDILLTMNPTIHYNMMGHGCAAHVNVQ